MEQLEIRALNTYYGESHILRDVDLTVNSGEMVCLIGRNGVGKTTLLKSIIGLLKPRSGQINFAEQCLDRQPPINGLAPVWAMCPWGAKSCPNSLLRKTGWGA